MTEIISEIIFKPQKHTLALNVYERTSKTPDDIYILGIIYKNSTITDFTQKDEKIDEKIDSTEDNATTNLTPNKIPTNLQKCKNCNTTTQTHLKKKCKKGKTTIQTHSKKKCKNVNIKIQINRKEFEKIINTYKLSEYQIMSHIFTLQLPNNQIVTALIKQTQRQCVKNHIQLIHLDFQLISDESVIKKRRVATGFTNQDVCQDYKNGCIPQLNRFIYMPKLSTEKLSEMPVEAIADMTNLSKKESISYKNQHVMSLTKR